MFIKPPNFFLRELPGGFDKLFLVDGLPGLARPSAPVFTVTPGEYDGEATIELSANPAGWGDAAVVDDGAGAPGILQWWNSVEGWQTLVDPAPPDEDLPLPYPIVLPEALWGVEGAPVRVRGVSATPLNGAHAQQLLDVPAAEPEGGLSTLLGYYDSAPLLGWADNAPLEYDDA